MFCCPGCSGLSSKFPVVAAKVICPKRHGPLPSTRLLRTLVRALFVYRTVPGVFSIASCANLRTIFFSCPQRLPMSCFSRIFFLHISSRSQVRHLNCRTELRSRAGELSEAFGLQVLDHCNQSFLIYFGRINVEFSSQCLLLFVSVFGILALFRNSARHLPANLVM